MNIEQQALELVKKNEELEAQVESLKADNQTVKDEADYREWLAHEELKKQGDVHQKENEELKAENKALLYVNRQLGSKLQSQIKGGKPADLVCLLRDELKEYSDVHQAGSINAIKADAVIEFTAKLIDTGQFSGSDCLFLSGFAVEVAG